MANDFNKVAPKTTTTAQPEGVTTVTSSNPLPYFVAHVSALGGQPLVVQCESEDVSRQVYRRECKGLDLAARIDVRPATNDEIQRAMDDQRVVTAEAK